MLHWHAMDGVLERRRCSERRVVPASFAGMKLGANPEKHKDVFFRIDYLVPSLQASLTPLASRAP